MGEVSADRRARLDVKLSDAEATLSEIELRMTGGGGKCEGLPAICHAWDVPYGLVLLWLMADPERYARYNRALELQAKHLVAETVMIADEGDDVARDKLRVDTRFRIAKYHDAAVYGDKGAGGGGGIRVVINRGIGNPPVGDGVSIETGGQTLTISDASGGAVL